MTQQTVRKEQTDFLYLKSDKEYKKHIHIINRGEEYFYCCRNI